MDKREFTTAEREALPYWRFHQPHPRGQRQRAARYLQRQGLAPEAISRLGAISKPTLSRSLHAYRAGGIAKLHEVPLHRRQGQWAAYRTSIAADWRPRPPARGAEAAARSAALTGLQRGPTQVRQFLKTLGRQPRNVGQRPAQAAVAAPEALKTEQRAPRLEEAKAGQRVVFLLEAAHGVCAPFWGLMGGCARLFVTAPRGRQRCKVWAALNATTRASLRVRNLPSITSETVGALLRLLAGAHPGMPLTIVLDNARSQRCALGHSLAQRLGMALLFFPASAPHLNLLERLWKFVKKQWLYSKYSADHLAFQQAIIEGIEQASDPHPEALASLLPLTLQSCTAVQGSGEESNISLFPVARRTQRKVSSIAA